MVIIKQGEKMLEFLGFVALIALVFGIKLTDALGGVFKFIAIVILICIILGIIGKLLESKKGTLFVLIASIGAIAFGIFLINDNYYNRTLLCDTWPVGYRASCLLSANDDHNASVNTGWGYAICGSIVGLIAFTTYYGEDDKSQKPKPKPRTHSAV